MQKAETDIILRQHVIRTLLYFDIFRYPLKSSEIFHFLGMNSITEKDVIDALNDLLEENLLFRFKEFYSTQPNEANIDRRIKGNIQAEKYLRIAQRVARFISAFPFVRAVFASGSLSKGYMDEKSDLDFFIVTAAGRLWIARTLLVMFKRIFLFNSHKYFCTNYFVDEDHLEIEEKNLFTATEVATVIPLYGSSHYEHFMAVNPWLKGFFPNYIPRSTRDVPNGKVKGIKKAVENIINVLSANKLETYFRNFTLNRWRRIYEKEYPKADFEIAFKSKKYASKNHPKHFQRKVMELHAEKIRLFGLSSMQAKEIVKN